MPRPSVNPRWQVDTIPDLTAGLFTDGSLYNAVRGSASQADNVEYQLDGSLGIRSGYRVLSPALPRVPTHIQSSPTGLLTADLTGAVFRDRVLIGATVSPPTQLIASSSGDIVVTINDVLSIRTSALVNVTDQTIPAPDTAQADGGTLPTGTYDYVVTWVDDRGGESPISAPVRVTVSSTTDQVTLSGTGVPEGQVQVRVYRKLEADTAYLRIGTADVTAGSWTFVDDGKPQITQGPPIGLMRMQGGDMATFSAGRLWVMLDNVLTYSNPDSPFYRSGFNQETVALPNGDTPTAIAPYNQGVVIFGSRSAVFVSGPPIAGGSLIPLNVTDGCRNNTSWAVMEGQLAFVGMNYVWALQGQNAVRLNPTTSEMIKLVTVPHVAYDPVRRALMIATGNNILSLQFLDGRTAMANWTIDAEMVAHHDGVLYAVRGSDLLAFDAVNDAGAAIRMTWASTPIDFGDATLHKKFRRSVVRLTYSSDVTANLSMADNFGYSDATIAGEGFSAMEPGTRWDIGRWDVDLWGAGRNEGSTKLMCPADLEGAYVTLGVQVQAADITYTKVIAPLSVEFRVRDRYARG